MATAVPALSYTGLFVLQALERGHRFGFDIMDVTGLPSGTIYPALRRLEALALGRSDWEPNHRARGGGGARGGIEEWSGELHRAAAVLASRRFPAVRLLRMALGAVPDVIAVRRAARF